MLVDVSKYTGGCAACNGFLLRGKNAYVAVDAPQGFAAWVLKHMPRGARLSELIITHQHFDHVEDAARLKMLTGCRICAHSPYSAELALEEKAIMCYGINPITPFEVDEVLGAERREANWGGLDWQLYHVPGHSPDGMAFGLAESRQLFTGDILFREGIGRPDLPGGNLKQLLTGIREKLMVLDPETVVYCGHDHETTIQHELLNNAYIN